VVVSLGGEPDGGYRLRIQDTGIGISPPDLPKVREPFVQVASAFSREHEGTGLGLAVVHQIVLAHGWEVECLPGKNSGARFRIAGMKLIGKS